jgi:single-stranded DNA-binding protein
MSEKELLLMANKFKRAVEKMTDAKDATSGNQQSTQQGSQQAGPPNADFSQERGKTQQYSSEEVAQAAKKLTLPEEDDDLPF